MLRTSPPPSPRTVATTILVALVYLGVSAAGLALLIDDATIPGVALLLVAHAIAGGFRFSVSRRLPVAPTADVDATTDQTRAERSEILGVPSALRWQEVAAISTISLSALVGSVLLLKPSAAGAVAIGLLLSVIGSVFVVWRAKRTGAWRPGRRGS